MSSAIDRECVWMDGWIEELLKELMDHMCEERELEDG